MSRFFDGTDDQITCSIGNCDVGFGAFAAIIKRASDGSRDAIIVLHSSAGIARTGIHLTTVNNLAFAIDNSGQDSTFTVLAAEDWVLVAAGKVTGSAIPRMHKYVFGTGVWTHSDAPGAHIDGATVAGGTVRFSNIGAADPFPGKMALAAVFPTNLSDANVETLAKSLQNWYALGPVGGWVFDQRTVATTLADWTGGGANETSITGTTVSAEEPPAFIYGIKRSLHNFPKPRLRKAA